MVGVPVGVVAGVLGVLVTGIGGYSGPGAGALAIVLPILGALAGFFLGFALPLLWHSRKLRMAAVAGSVAGALCGIVVGWSNRDANAWVFYGEMIACVFYGAVAGFLLGCVILPLRHLWQLLTGARRARP
jgi:hypothetical protein